MLTTKKIDDRFEEFATNSAFLRAYSRGQMADFNQAKDDEYPRLHVVYKGASFEENEKTLDYELYFLSLPSSDHDDAEQIQMVSDMERVAEDLLGDLFMHRGVSVEDTTVHFANTVNRGTDFGMNYKSASMTPMVESTKNVLCGVRLDLRISVAWRKT
jgi:hypothetical protein